MPNLLLENIHLIDLETPPSQTLKIENIYLKKKAIAIKFIGLQISAATNVWKINGIK